MDAKTTCKSNMVKSPNPAMSNLKILNTELKLRREFQTSNEEAGQSRICPYYDTASL